MHILTIDGSFFAQRMLHAEKITFKENPEVDKKRFIRILVTSLCNEVKTIGTLDHITFCTDSRSWRKKFTQVYPIDTIKAEEKQGYKNNRENVEKSYDWDSYSEAYWKFIEIIKDKFNVQIITVNGAEADDSCAIVAKTLTGLNPNVYVTAWSSDGDYVQIVEDRVSLIKLPNKKIYRPLSKAKDVSMLSVFGKKTDTIIQPLIASYGGAVEYVNPAYSALVKLIGGDGKDNVPGLWKWPSKSGTRFYSITKKHLLEAMEKLNVTKETLTYDHLYDLVFMKKLIRTLLFTTKHYTRFAKYDAKEQKGKAAQIEESLNELISDAYLQEMHDHVEHSLNVYVSNRKMKLLNDTEIPEEVVSAIVTEIKSAKGTANIKALSDTNSALQMINLQETTSYFDKFNLEQ